MVTNEDKISLPCGTYYPIKLFQCNNVYEMVDYIETLPRKDSPTMNGTWDDKCFYGKLWDDAKKELFGVNENNSVMCNLSSEIDHILDESEAKTTKRIRNDMFGSVNTKYYMAGDDRCLTARRRKRDKRKTLNLIVETGYHWEIDADSVINRGAAMLSLIKRLKENYFVNLHLCWKVKEKGDCFHDDETRNVIFDLNLNDNSIVDNQTISYALTKLEWFRRFGFAMLERSVDKRGALRCAHYGNMRDIDKDEIENIFSGKDEKYIHVGRIEDNRPWCTIQKAAETLAEQIIPQINKEN